ncbi:MAG: CoA transferase [Chloroflexota bacterium]
MPRKRVVTQTRGPLERVRILDITRATAGPMATMYLADLGAEVIKIETPVGSPGVSSRAQSDPRYTILGEDYHFHTYNRNKKSIVIDLRQPEGKELFLGLVKKSDIVFENFRPGVMKRLGLGYDTLSKINPKIVYCCLSGFGQDGPHRDKPAFDLVVQAMSGILDICGRRDNERVYTPGVATGDHWGGLLGCCGTLAALYSREVTGKGQMVDVSLLDGMVSFLSFLVTYQLNLGWFKERVDIQLWAGMKTKDGMVVVAAHREGFWKNLCVALGHEEWQTDPRFDTQEKRKTKRDMVLGVIEEVLKTKTTDEWLRILTEGDVPCCRLNTIADAVVDPQVLHRNMIISVKHPSGVTLKMPGNPIKMSGTVEESFQFAPSLGQHTDQILTDLLGYPQDTISELRKKKVI